MKKISLLLLLGIGCTAFAQGSETEINDQVWKPFIKSFNTRNSTAFLAVHSKDVVRSPRDAKDVFGWDEYLLQLERGKSKTPGGQRLIELRFTERIVKDQLAVDVGIYKTTFQDKKGVRKSDYGRFHVVLRKEYGIWKILVDMDSSEGGTIGEKDFLAAQEM